MANLNATLYGNTIINENNIEFNGSNQYAMTQNAFNLGLSRSTMCTLEIRFRVSGFDTYMGLFQIASTRYTWIGCFINPGSDINNGTIHIFVGNNISGELIQNKAIANIQANVDYTLTIVRDETYYHIYIDGILIVSHNKTGSDSSGFLYLGNSKASYNSGGLGNYYFKGKIYAFRYYHGKALTQAEVESNVAMDKQRFE